MSIQTLAFTSVLLLQAMAARISIRLARRHSSLTVDNVDRVENDEPKEHGHDDHIARPDVERRAVKHAEEGEDGREQETKEQTHVGWVERVDELTGKTLLGIPLAAFKSQLGRLVGL